MARIHLITFGGGGRRYRAAARRVVRQSRGFPEIVTATAFGPEDLDAGYHALFPDFATRYPRGFGLWSWKPYLIKQQLEKIPEGEFLLYLDAGCELNRHAQARLQDYIKHAERHDAFITQPRFRNIVWTKADPRLFPSEEFGNDYQLQSGILLLRNCERIKALISDWMDICALDDGYLLKDVEAEPQVPEFIEHRHDQSCLSVVATKHRINGFDDETWFPPKPLKAFLEKTRNKPILALRNTDVISYLPLMRLLGWFLNIRSDQ